MHWVIYASGHVQGVGFRASAKVFADQKGIKGYAKNLPDGRVKLEAVGDLKDLEWFCESIKTVPGDGQTELNISKSEIDSQFDHFSIPAL